MRRVAGETISRKVAEMCVAANRELPPDVTQAFKTGAKVETSAAGRETYRQLLLNAELAQATGLPLCQDCGLAVFFVEIGQDVCVTGMGLREAINEGMVTGYREGYLRKSTCDPFSRENRRDNSPAIIHFDVVPGDTLTISMLAKGGGSENMSRVAMLAPSLGWAGIREYVIRLVAEAGANPCPPIIIGLGIGGSFETAPIMAKKALLRPVGDTHADSAMAEREIALLRDINKLGIGPMGLGGSTTCLGVKIQAAPCHISSLPLAVNIQCHSARHRTVAL